MNTETNEQQWSPIETAPKDETLVDLGQRIGRQAKPSKNTEESTEGQSK